MSYAGIVPTPSVFEISVDLYSDTVSRPTAGMRAAMMDAPVGDEQKGEDPSTNELTELARQLLGKDAAVFLPSGTMCNQISYAIHCRPGDEILVDDTAHALHYEGGGPAALAGALLTPITADHGVFTADELDKAIRPPGRHAPRSRLVSIEQTSNLGGGRCWTLDEITSVTDTAKGHGLRCHMDGARLLNAVVATGVSARDFCEPFDSVWLDLSKGLGAPFGAILAGDVDFIEEAWRLKQRWGGAMRQSGIVAAAGTYALRHHVDRLAHDHDHARALAEAISTHPRVSLDPARVQTNIVIFDLIGTRTSAADLAERLLRETGLRIGAFGPSTLRALTHLDVTSSDIHTAGKAICALLDVVE
ncbi:threonine aldolase family protein [Rhodococcus koreensis]|uniref:threonine aldolase family protein n=1 Tax=Rhodococcus koreensis TaxID=99653 RepID=UPI00366DE5F1